MSKTNAVFWAVFVTIVSIALNTFIEHPVLPQLQFWDGFKFTKTINEVPDMYSPNGTKPVKAAFVILVRNTELIGMRKAMQSIEDRFNRKHNYPYVFLNDVPFTEEFIEGTRTMTRAKTSYGLIPKEHWSYPDHIDVDLAKQKYKEMGENSVHYGATESYHLMCNFQSGYFFRHPLLEEYDYYWRIEPNVEYPCDIDFDPFLHMQNGNYKYSFTITLYEYPNTIPTIWSAVKEFIETYPELIPERNAFQWIARDGGKKYTGCHFWSNFEIADLRFFRSKEYITFYDFLSSKGGFFYERWGDAVVHSLAVALFLQKEDVYWFKDLGYFHHPWTNCPLGDEWIKRKCTCTQDTLLNSQTHKYAECGFVWDKLPGKDDKVDLNEPLYSPYYELDYN
ncbi:hypothetical protein H4219_002267 [Mycoemilia scoparia]|uniref:Uncharacterized protein n=1 Tax=Mycoemilia scoparia TaxID=417184 RepID=A0A9W8A4J4_9FUNG|nr:hypothetical protein H4219_002267 [Mycoemilia scoparia]